jgi:hypothetical protein
MSKTILKVLKTDQKNRYEGIEDDLFPINSLTSDQSLDYDDPTLINSRFDYNESIKLCNNIKDFKKKFYERYPFLRKLNMKNLLIAGGAIGGIVKEPNGYSKSDVDFFVYGLTTKAANKRVKEWIVDVITCAKNYNENDNDDDNDESDDENEDDTDDEESPKKKPVKKSNNLNKKKYIIENDFEMIRNNNTLLIKICGFEFQLIFRLYQTVSEILHGFDLGSSAVGFDGKQVYFTTLGKFCYEHSCNIVDTTRRSTTYEHRLEKYFDRGFNIVVPKLNMNKLKKDYFKFGLEEICNTPYFIFSYTDIIGNKIVVKKFYNQYVNKIDTSIPNVYTSDYKIDDINEYNSFRINLYNLVHDINYMYYTSTSLDIDNIDILNKSPRISKGGIISFYELLRRKMSKKSLDIQLIEKFITVKTTTEILKIIMAKDNKKLDSIITKQIDEVLLKLNKLDKKDHSKINWITKNPGKQLTGSFNPIIKNEKDWYGDYYNKGK